MQCERRKRTQLEEQLLASKFSFKQIKEQPKVLKFYTGIDLEAIEFILNIMGNSVRSSCRHTTIETEHFHGLAPGGKQRALLAEDEVLLTLCKHRHDFPEEDLASRFCIHQATVSRIFTSMLEVMDSCFSEIDLWPDKESVMKNMPELFGAKCPDTRVIIDAAEIPIERPLNPDTQSLTWSSYKNRNTVKFLLGVTPNGVPCFISPCFGGRISDKELTKRSGLLDTSRFCPGDAIMADRGLTISDLLAGTGIKLNHPPFLFHQLPFVLEEVIVTRRIASLRIHVERTIERIKNFRILSFPQATRVNTASRLVRTCAFLTTLMDPLVPPVIFLNSTGKF